jgi:hypothetical protein
VGEREQRGAIIYSSAKDQIGKEGAQGIRGERRKKKRKRKISKI